ncbi:small ubiquitin-related modifier 1-like isoform X2 [Olea europaea var. sylvestris]|uniref:Small ubiquitin-related modifier 1-like n=1 Tax=Olea europaea subsp. europaea TaxID=158383 RepID=A0A8S0PQB4_OLEEU|nr:small ubiquitin-related modifier 1-like isoform X2 [Olea europaea var. sylvestris]CAA2956105.1 small ubiquitin-related modifier 1-like [Olea europaea subsp. europaea]
MANLAQEEGKKPGLNSSFINIGVHSQEADVVFFRIKRTTQLKKLMNAYCDKRDRDIVYFEFLLNGDRIKGEQTPNELGMKDGDQIDAFTHCDGGALA